MMYKYVKIEKLVFLLLFLLCGVYTHGQDFNGPPTLVTNTNCKEPTNTSIEFGFRFNLAFPNDNEFRIELSNADGVFDDPADMHQDVGAVARVIGGVDTNQAFFVDGARFDLPAGSYSPNYRIRLVASNPAVTSAPSDPFEAYYIVPEDMSLVNAGAETLCGGETKTIALANPKSEYTYTWFKDTIEVPGETGPSLVVSQPGQYYVAIDYGACTASGVSNQSIIIPVTTGVAPSSVRINGPDLIEICANETYELESSITDPSYTYIWYKDGAEITGINSSTYEPPVGNQFGVFHLEISVGGCVTRSQNDVTIQQRSAAGFDIGIEGSATVIRLPRETATLEINNAPSSATIAWFLDGVELPGSNSTEWNAVQEGVYTAVVTDNTSTCPVSDTSPEITVLDVTAVTPIIRPGNGYADCSNGDTDLTIQGIKVIASDGNEYDLTDEQINHPDYIRYQWLKDGVEITGETLTQLSLDSYNDNGSYSLEADLSPSLVGLSDEIDILLTLENAEITSSSISNKLCPGGTITFSIPVEPGFTYRWFKDDVELTVADPSTLVISEVGVYRVTFEGFGCLIDVPEIEVVEFDETVLEVTPSSTAVLEPGETVRFEATGADSYEWYNENGDLLSSSDALEVDILGTYTLVGFVDSCRAERELNVVEDDGKLMIPNIISPFNGDGVNDTWELPNRFAFQTDVQVIIYNSGGKEVLNTTDYQNDWPLDNNLKDGMLFYFRVIKNEDLVKAGTISILR
ncbi:gliding motility-associated C-terminal domain-containing protein [Tenacibaculum sp. M341]|uniref:T9SS type B sorting domain-containing protein n=1 Tax=Tenacibaculum sp. M341 TaxID=2530339 RepID=UPI001046CBA1|nr:gliding motility-associated C-terminal domain-containing protein [Tenacibaculum sp. M341]TCI85247.1 hypothetical protein EYW44_17535 [Tenacibaculum sp. M341]